MNIRVKSIDLSGAIAKAGKAERRVKTMVTLAAREDTEQYVPYQGGALRRSAETASNPEQGQLIYATPYARAQYYGLPGKRTPGTQMQWFVASRAANLDKWVRIAEKEARKA